MARTDDPRENRKRHGGDQRHTGRDTVVAVDQIHRARRTDQIKRSQQDNCEDIGIKRLETKIKMHTRNG